MMYQSQRRTSLKCGLGLPQLGMPEKKGSFLIRSLNHFNWLHSKDAWAPHPIHPIGEFHFGCFLSSHTTHNTALKLELRSTFKSKIFALQLSCFNKMLSIMLTAPIIHSSCLYHALCYSKLRPALRYLCAASGDPQAIKASFFSKTVSQACSQVAAMTGREDL